ncbi:MAG: hypothetical protein MPK62_00855 [Alphaproteobacteria bacterium]|nr:hypothetical protein [Alphaproteobacteria bacterium]MDA8029683.1 hypothetical protein [Alphaproteobacteria bacterium]
MKHLALLAVLALAPAMAYADNTVEDLVKDFRTGHAEPGKFNCHDNELSNWTPWTNLCAISNSLESAKQGSLLISYDRDGDVAHVAYSCKQYEPYMQTGGWVLQPDGSRVYDNNIVITSMQLVEQISLPVHPADENGLMELRALLKSPTCS